MRDIDLDLLTPLGCFSLGLAVNFALKGSAQAAAAYGLIGGFSMAYLFAALWIEWRMVNLPKVKPRRYEPSPLAESAGTLTKFDREYKRLLDQGYVPLSLIIQRRVEARKPDSEKTPAEIEADDQAFLSSFGVRGKK
jgi:hypothetical protein